MDEKRLIEIELEIKKLELEKKTILDGQRSFERISNIKIFNKKKQEKAFYELSEFLGEELSDSIKNDTLSSICAKLQSIQDTFIDSGWIIKAQKLTKLANNYITETEEYRAFKLLISKRFDYNLYSKLSGVEVQYTGYEVNLKKSSFKKECDLEEFLFNNILGNSDLRVERQKSINGGILDLELNSTEVLELKANKATLSDIDQVNRYRQFGEYEEVTLIALEFDDTTLEYAKKLKVNLISYKVEDYNDEESYVVLNLEHLATKSSFAEDYNLINGFQILELDNNAKSDSYYLKKNNEYLMKNCNALDNIFKTCSK